MWKFMRFHIELICALSLTCGLQNKWAMLDGESKLLILEALVKKIIILDVLRLLVCKHFITSELR